MKVCPTLVLLVAAPAMTGCDPTRGIARSENTAGRMGSCRMLSGESRR